MKKKTLLVPFLLLMIVSACNDAPNNTKESTENKDTVNSQTVTFTDEQIKVAEIKTGKLDSIKMHQEIYCTGTVEASPGNIAKVSVPLPAFIDKIYVRHGVFVNKGQKILSFKHTDFIDLQSNYLKLKTELKVKKQEYQRQKKLFEENAVSEKKFRQTEAEYETILTEFKALEQKLIMIGISPNQLTPEKISSTIELKAPISGYVDEINVTAGQYVEPKDILFEIIKPGNYTIMLNVYTKYKHLIKIGDQVQFRACDKCPPEKARIYSIGQIVDPQSKTFKVHAIPESKDTRLTVGSFVNAKILINNAKVPALPINSVIQKKDGEYIFIKTSKNDFQIVKVKTGISDNNYIEILSPDTLWNKEIVINGANYLFTKLNE